MLKRGYSVDEIRETLGTTIDVEPVTAETTAHIIKLYESDEIPFHTSVELVNNTNVRPEVQIFISKLKAYERIHSDA